MHIARALAGRFAIGAAVIACLVLLAACGGSSQSDITATATAAAGDSAAGSSELSDSAAAVLKAYASYGGKIAALDVDNPSATTDVADLTGTIAAYELTGGNPPCPGFVSQVPSLVFTLAADQPAVKVSFAGNQATNLILVKQGGVIDCPQVAAATLTPEITLTDAKAGQYGIWVGRINMTDPVNGKLTASLSQ
jgi:hypothetical protein